MQRRGHLLGLSLRDRRADAYLGPHRTHRQAFRRCLPIARQFERFMGMCIPEPNSGCWLWLGPLKKGPRVDYGRAPYGTRSMGAHRASYFFHFGPVSSDVCIRHKCDNSLCVNPDHLQPGAFADNNDDMMRRGRLVIPRGEQHGQHKLTAEKVYEIRAIGRSQPTKLTAKRFGINVRTLNAILSRRWWSHLPPIASTLTAADTEGKG